MKIVEVTINSSGKLSNVNIFISEKKPVLFSNQQKYVVLQLESLEQLIIFAQ